MTTEFVTNYLDKKIYENEDFIVCKFYDLRVKQNLTEESVQQFLSLAKIRLENMNYLVYFTGAKYKYKGESKRVKDNEYMVAIKEREVH